MKIITPASKKYLFFFVFLAVSFCLYFNSLNNEFVLDDKDLIVNNAYIKNIKLLPSIFFKNIYQFSSEQRSNHYRPLQLASYALDYNLWRLNPLGYRLTNIFLHALSSFLAYLFVSLLFGRQGLALLAALLYCAFPLHSSAVAYIAGRADILAAVFMLLGLIKFLKYAQTQNIREYTFSVIFFFLALLSRENALLLPFLVLLSCFVIRAKNKNTLLSLSGFFIIGFFYAIIRFFVLKNFKFFLAAGTFPSFSFTLINSLNLLKKYLLLFAWPWPLYPMRTTPFVQYLSAADIVLLAGLFSLALILGFKERQRIIAFGASWFIIALSPAILLIYTFRPIGATMAENWLYLPAIGLFIIIGYLLSRAGKSKKALFLFIFSFYGILTIGNNKNWKDDLTLYRHILKFSPDNYIARINLASVYSGQGRYDEAIAELEPLIAKKEASWAALLQMANVYLAKGEINQAVEYCEKSIAINPHSGQAYYNLGLLYEIQGKEKESLDAYLKALQINPVLWKPYLSIGDRLMRKNLPRVALKFYQRALVLSPRDKETRSRLEKAIRAASAQY
ncbi:MAG: tetratricopeptide repeat protein [Candidatus Omnitrophota bacterium]